VPEAVSEAVSAMPEAVSAVSEAMSAMSEMPGQLLPAQLHAHAKVVESLCRQVEKAMQVNQLK